MAWLPGEGSPTEEVGSRREAGPALEGRVPVERGGPKVRAVIDAGGMSNVSQGRSLMEEQEQGEAKEERQRT